MHLGSRSCGLMASMPRHWTMLPLICCMLLLLVSADIELIVTNHAPGTVGSLRFDKTVGFEAVLGFMSDAITFVLSVFDYSIAGVPHRDLRKITFILEIDTGTSAAYATWSETEGEIHFNAKYFGDFRGDFVKEIKGVLYHEMTHLWQWNGKGNAPSGLIEGIASFVTLKANLAHWSKLGDGDNWDQGYAVTANFLSYCDDLRPGFVAALNAELASGWSESFFSYLLGKSVQDLWNDYKHKYN